MTFSRLHRFDHSLQTTVVRDSPPDHPGDRRRGVSLTVSAPPALNNNGGGGAPSRNGKDGSEPPLLLPDKKRKKGGGGGVEKL